MSFIPDNFTVTDWNALKPYYDDLKERTLDRPSDLEKWLLDWNQLDAAVGEDMAWRYVQMSRDAGNEAVAQRYQFAVQEIAPKIAPYEDALNRKLTGSPLKDELDATRYHVFLRGVQNEVELFREENIPLSTEAQLLSKRYGEISAAMTVQIDGREMTLQQAGSLLEETDRERRERVWRALNERVMQDSEPLEEVFDGLVRLRHEMAQNAGFDNYRDFKFRQMGRFDYSVEDCMNFHDAIAEKVCPLQDEMNRYRQERLGVDPLRPWDLSVDVDGSAPLRPFKDTDELLEKSIEVLRRVDPYFGDCLEQMSEMGHLDLESRPGKHPGGYNMPLLKTGVPFIFMNATQSFSDMRTLFHEAGHAVHSFLTRDYELTSDKRLTPEIAELASMTMELLTMDYWDVFFNNAEELKRAKIKQLAGVLKTLPWIATIDQFQHWIYTHPDATRTERSDNWTRIFNRFRSDVVDRSGLKKYTNGAWYRQLHLFEVPFYYIEYGFAQLGAIAIWKRYRENPDAAIAAYQDALKLGYTKTIPEMYAAAGIAFDFTPEYVGELTQFVKGELDNLLV